MADHGVSGDRKARRSQRGRLNIRRRAQSPFFRGGLARHRPNRTILSCSTETFLLNSQWFFSCEYANIILTKTTASVKPNYTPAGTRGSARRGTHKTLAANASKAVPESRVTPELSANLADALPIDRCDSGLFPHQEALCLLAREVHLTVLKRGHC